MEKNKVRVPNQKGAGGFMANGAKSHSLIQLDVRNLDTKSLSSLIEERKREFKTTATQTNSEDQNYLHLKTCKEKYELDRVALERKFTKEKSEMEIKLTKHYKDVLEQQNKLIKALTNEKDFLWEEMRYIKESVPLVDENTNSTPKDLEWDLEWDPFSNDVRPKIPGKFRKQKDKTIPPFTVQDKEIILCSLMRLRRQTILQKYKREKQALLDKREIEKDLIRDAITSELEAQYDGELKYLRDTIDGLNEALADMKEQKSELAKIFQGERNALEMEFCRKEQELKDNMARDLQRELVKAHQDWLNTKI
ncbi:hypothetical protein QZH41_002836 [Actinostola sp. cb2023]|nr:hypothetical protein QZH41_002836 [Actinostola sp. cb2023]